MASILTHSFCGLALIFACTWAASSIDQAFWDPTIIDQVVSTLPEVKMNVPEMLKFYGYHVETHTVTTPDGYVLTLFRIPCKRHLTPEMSGCTGRTLRPVFLQHGLFSSAAAWMLNLPHQSLAYTLADNGYDVWMGNVRGNEYSQSHTTLSKTDAKFWDFSWQEMAEQDLPAMIDYVLKTTKISKLSYVGHSQGTLMGFAKFSSDWPLAKKINHFFAMAPIATLQNVKCPPKNFINFIDQMQDAVKLSGYFSTQSIIEKVPSICGQPSFESICRSLMFDLCGAQPRRNFNETRIPVYMAHARDDTSVKNVIHFGQMVKSGLMQKYDFKNAEQNRNKYNQVTPPVFDLERMLINTTIFYSLDDSLADPTDVHNLIPRLKHLRSIRVDAAHFSHMDFLWAIRARDLVYPHILEILAEKF